MQHQFVVFFKIFAAGKSHESTLKIDGTQSVLQLGKPLCVGKSALARQAARIIHSALVKCRGCGFNSGQRVHAADRCPYEHIEQNFFVTTGLQVSPIVW